MTIAEILARADCSINTLDQKTAVFWEANTRAYDKEALNFAEFGVHTGGTAAIIATCINLANPKLHLHLFDSWASAPKSDAIATLARFGLDKRCVFHDGPFQTTAPKFDLPLMFAHIDCGHYMETCAVLKRVLNLMHKRGSIIVQTGSKSLEQAVKDSIHGGWFIQPSDMTASALISKV